MDPRSWAGFVQDAGEPEPFTFRGAGPPATATVEGVFAIGRRVVVSIWPAEPGTSVEVATAA